MSKNPNPGRITNEMWYLWENRPNRSWKLGGIYADKAHYHNTVNNNRRHWPSSYSIKLSLDKKGPLDKGRGIDLTMSDSEMRKWTKRMKDSALNPKDHRLDAVREFYGTLDSKNVYGLIKDSATGSWRRSSANKSHLWHGHVSVFTYFVNNLIMLAPLLSVWKGDSLKTWENSVGASQFFPFFPKYNDFNSPAVKYWQHIHNLARKYTIKPIPILAADGDYGPKTAAGVLAFYKTFSKGTFDGKEITPWIASEYHLRLAIAQAPKIPEFPKIPDPIDKEVLRGLVNDWLDEHIPNKLKIIANLEGTVDL